MAIMNDNLYSDNFLVLEKKNYIKFTQTLCKYNYVIAMYTQSVIRSNWDCVKNFQNWMN